MAPNKSRQYIKQKQRERQLEIFLLVFVGLVVAGALFYVLNEDFRGLARPYHCLLNSATGLLCPACGGTRALGELLRGNLWMALRYNAMVVVVIPLALYGIFILGRVVLSKSLSLTDLYIKPFWLWSILIFAVVFAVARNLPHLDYLGFPLK